MAQARDIIDDASGTAVHAMCTTVATTLRSAPRSLILFLNVPLIADWQAIAIACLHEHHVHENLKCTNRKHFQYGYALGQQDLKKVHSPTKLGVRTKDPYTVDRAHINGSLTIIIHDGVTEHINICRVLRYH